MCFNLYSGTDQLPPDCEDVQTTVLSVLGKQFFILFSDDKDSELRLGCSVLIPFGSSVADPRGKEEEDEEERLQHWAPFDVEGT